MAFSASGKHHLDSPPEAADASGKRWRAAADDAEEGELADAPPPPPPSMQPPPPPPPTLPPPPPPPESSYRDGGGDDDAYKRRGSSRDERPYGSRSDRYERSGGGGGGGDRYDDRRSDRYERSGSDRYDRSSSSSGGGGGGGDRRGDRYDDRRYERSGRQYDRRPSSPPGRRGYDRRSPTPPRDRRGGSSAAAAPPPPPPAAPQKTAEEEEREYAERVQRELDAKAAAAGDEERMLAERKARRAAMLEQMQREVEEEKQKKAAAAAAAAVPGTPAVTPTVAAAVPATPRGAAAAVAATPVTSTASSSSSSSTSSSSVLSATATPMATDGDDDGGLGNAEAALAAPLQLTRRGGGTAATAATSAAAAVPAIADMFSDSPSMLDGLLPRKGLLDSQKKSKPADIWDDEEGYYRFTVGEVLLNRYQVTALMGKGVFSTVLRAKDFQAANAEVAIKVIRANETLLKAGAKERDLLAMLYQNDPEGRKHCIRLLDSFDFRGHLCLVLEPMAMNLRDLIKKFGKDVGINIGAVKIYAKQLFVALRFLQTRTLLHADIKPDNIVVNDSCTQVKLCDFGSASLVTENEITPYLVSRYYRAPEVILGLSYDYAIDIWSIGCVLAELYTGKILFPGRTNNDMLRLFMETKGRFPRKMLQKAMFGAKHFDDDGNFLRSEEDPVSRRPVVRVVKNITVTRDLQAMLLGEHHVSDDEYKALLQLKDLLDRCFVLDPAKRLTIAQALSHPFLQGAGKS